MSRLDAYKPNLKKAGKLFGEALGSIISIPSNIKRANADADANAIRRARDTKNAPKLDIDNKPTDAFKARVVADSVIDRRMKEAKKAQATKRKPY